MNLRCLQAADKWISLRNGRGVVLSIASGFLTALIWASARDPFHRIDFVVRTGQGENVRCIAVLPKAGQRFPSVVCLHDKGETLDSSGNYLRPVAELGLAAVDFEYNQTNAGVFEDQFLAVLRRLSNRAWAKRDAMAWLGVGAGARHSFRFALKRTEYRPRLLIQIDAGWLDQLDAVENALPREITAVPADCSAVLVNVQRGANGSLPNATALSLRLQRLGWPTEIIPVAALSEDPTLLTPLVVRRAAEQCAAAFGPVRPMRTNARPTLWQYWMPFCGLQLVVLPRTLATCSTRRSSKEKTVWHKRLCLLAWVVTALALSATALNLGLLMLRPGPVTEPLAARVMVSQGQENDFKWLTRNTSAPTPTVAALVDWVRLCDLQKRAYYQNLDHATYRNFVLSGFIATNCPTRLDWRRPLWEATCPRIKGLSDPTLAATLVAQFLRSRITVLPDLEGPAGVAAMWDMQITNVRGFERIYIAALRSIGIAARLSQTDKAEFWTGTCWREAPPPVL
jgi:hypothetical protein